LWVTAATRSPEASDNGFGIARAIIRNNPILILDEPTAALDSESEKRVIEALERSMKGKTVLTIAHRLSTIRDTEKIIVLKDGVVAEQGTHDQLLALGGTYAGMPRCIVYSSIQRWPRPLLEQICLVT
jgi:ABC-type multidrug transport system fused ATPase/permease subunit